MADGRALPEGWRIEGLWTGVKTGGAEYTPVNTRTVTDAQIAGADRIVVSYTSRRTGVTDYRMIGRATSKRQIGSIIRYTTRRVSPVGRRSR